VLVAENCHKLHDEYHQLVTTCCKKAEKPRSFTEGAKSDGNAIPIIEMESPD